MLKILKEHTFFHFSLIKPSLNIEIVKNRASLSWFNLTFWVCCSSFNSVFSIFLAHEATLDWSLVINSGVVELISIRLWAEWTKLPSSAACGRRFGGDRRDVGRPRSASLQTEEEESGNQEHEGEHFQLFLTRIKHRKRY